MAPVVTIPPPPIPANRPRQVCAGAAITGAARLAANSASRPPQMSGGGGGAPCVVTKLGQKPFRHDRSVLHAVGEIRRLRPNGVATGSMAMQLDWTVQSPQFSQTRSLIRTVCSAAAMVPRLRRRRFSVAQTWS